ncbi:MAG: two-component regulator propeller domain-containing protein [Lewinella sp.]
MPQSLIRKVFIYLFCLVSGLLYGTEAPGFDHLTVGNGLSHNTVYALLQDRSGMFWIGTRHGLNRYDGYDFMAFTPEDKSTSLNGPIVLSLLEDRGGRIWAGHRNAGISIYNKSTGSFTPFSLGEDGQNPVDWSTISVRALFQDSRGWIWIGTFGGGVIVLDADGELLHHFSTYAASSFAGKLSSDFVFDFAEDKEGDVYVATSGKGLNIIRLGEQKLEVLHAPDDDLSSFDKALCLASDGSVWVATSGSGLYRYFPTKKTWQIFGAPESISHAIVTDVAEDKQGNIWLSTDGGGLNVIDPNTGVAEVFMYSAVRASSLNTNALYCLLFDEGKNLWVGSFNGGLNVHRALQSPFITNRRYDLERQMGLRSVLSLAEDENGTTWLGTDGEGLFSYREDPTEVNAFRARPQVQGEDVEQVITALAPVGQSGLWYGSYAGGLGYVDLATGIVTKFRHQEERPESLAHDNVWDLAIDDDRGVWVGLLGGGLDYLAPGAKEFRHFIRQPNDEQSLSGNLVIDLLLDQNGKYLWVGTENSGLNRLDLASGTFQRFQHDPDDSGSISSNLLRHLFQDEEGTLWVGTEYNGLNALKPGATSFTRYNKDNGYPFTMVCGMETDNEGYYWITGLKRIFRWNKVDNSFLELAAEEELGYNLYNPGAIQKRAGGELVFGGVNGFSIVAPDRIPRPAEAPDVLLAELRLANRPILPGQQNGREILSGDLNAANTEISLSYQDRGIAFHFAAPAYPSPEEVRYAFRLEGFDEDWTITAPGERIAYFSSLKGGKYQLYVKAAGGDGVWGNVHTPLPIYVQPPFWKTRWFIITMAFLSLLFIYLLNRYLLSRQRERYQQQALARDREILRLKNRNLKEEVATKQSELGASLLQMAHKNEFLNDLKNKIQQLNDKEKSGATKSLRSVIRVIDHELKQEDYWEQFQLIFDQGYQNFVLRLREVHPTLSNNDSRLCCFIRMQLNNREIASVLNITLNGVEQAKYRLKKKMDLPRELSLNDYVAQFG